MSSVSSTTSTTSATTTSSTSSTDYLSFDTAELVEAKLASRYERLDSLETEVTDNETKISAYQDMQGLLQTLTDSLAALRSDPSSSGQSDDVFRDRQGYLTTSTGASADTYLSATVEPGTELGTHSIEIIQTATTNIVSSASQSSSSDDLGWSGSFSLGTEGGSTATITVTASMSLADIADSINAEQDTTGVKASVMKVSDDSYLLVLTTIETGQTITAADVDGSLLAGSDQLGLLDDDGAIAADNVLQAAQDAMLKVDGVTVTRSGNDIDDVLDGITLHLYATPDIDTTLTLEVDNDLDAVKEAVTAFVDAYNAFRDFVVTNQTTASDGTADDGATLFGDATLRDIAQRIQSVLTSSVDEQSLAALGISLDEDNKLVLDEDALDTVLLDDFDAVATLFSYQMTASSGDLTLLRHPDASLSFTLDVTVDGDGNLTGASIGGDSSMFTISGSTIRGAEGTAYEGLTLVYTGSTSKSISVGLSQGLADQLYYDVDAVANATDGTLVTVIDGLQEENDTLSDRISALEDSTASYRESLTTLYGTIAADLAAAQTTLDLLKALLNSDTSS